MRYIGFEYSRRSLRANVKSSMTHHSLEQYVGPGPAGWAGVHGGINGEDNGQFGSTHQIFKRTHPTWYEANFLDTALQQSS